MIIVVAPNAAPSSPRNVTAINVTINSITISWLRPDPANGVIESYSIRVERIDDGETERRISNISADVFEHNITGLMEFVNYSIVVFAFTDKGRGPGSEPIVVQTLEHRK